MRKRNYKIILYFITSVILITLGIQVYWNYKNYQASKQQLINEVQISLDNAVDEYFTELAKENAVFIMHDSMIGETVKNLHQMKKGIIAHNNFKRIDSFKINERTKISIVKDSNTQSIHIVKRPNLSMNQAKQQQKDVLFSITQNLEDSTPKNQDSILQVLSGLASKAIVSITQDSLKLGKINELIQKELNRKNINIDYGLRFTNPFGEKTEIDKNIIKTAVLQTKSKSSFLRRLSSLELFFTNERLTIFKKNLGGILLSFVLVASVIGCLLFLLRIINQQKQLAELKNDLISNITHEFKTPIATISVALEAIQNFNTNNDPEKTKKYVKMSSDQLERLNTMVEKILETATLDSEELELKLEKMDLIIILKTVMEKNMATISEEKTITFETNTEKALLNIDVFHFENAINNILDNAIKYGGNRIHIAVKKAKSNLTIEIIDDGTSLSKIHKEKIFDKFYRVPKGNTHDVKGFGIGLFYTRTIIEKHGATIQLLLDNKQTNFKINLSND